MGEPLITGGAPRLPAGGDALDSAGFGESPPELPNSGPEATSVAQLVKGKALIGSEATEEEVMRRLSSAPLIHIAAHGLVLTDPALNPLSGLALGKTGLEFGKDGFLQAAEILANGPTSAKLVYLSGCATADSEIGTGALVKAFLHTGSRCVIAARWVLDDKESVAMARDFYTKFTAGATAGEALLAAQKAARARNRHPYYWANLALFGDPTVKFKGD
jgi:CHAT domain-containing protein